MSGFNLMVIVVKCNRDMSKRLVKLNKIKQLTGKLTSLNSDHAHTVQRSQQLESNLMDSNNKVSILQSENAKLTQSLQDQQEKCRQADIKQTQLERNIRDLKTDLKNSDLVEKNAILTSQKAAEKIHAYQEQIVKFI